MVLNVPQHFKQQFYAKRRQYSNSSSCGTDETVATAESTRTAATASATSARTDERSDHSSGRRSSTRLPSATDSNTRPHARAPSLQRPKHCRFNLDANRIYHDQYFNEDEKSAHCWYSAQDYAAIRRGFMDEVTRLRQDDWDEVSPRGLEIILKCDDGAHQHRRQQKQLSRWIVLHYNEYQELAHSPKVRFSRMANYTSVDTSIPLAIVYAKVCEPCNEFAALQGEQDYRDAWDEVSLAQVLEEIERSQTHQRVLPSSCDFRRKQRTITSTYADSNNVITKDPPRKQLLVAETRMYSSPQRGRRGQRHAEDDCESVVSRGSVISRSSVASRGSATSASVSVVSQSSVSSTGSSTPISRRAQSFLSHRRRQQRKGISAVRPTGDEDRQRQRVRTNSYVVETRVCQYSDRTGRRTGHRKQRPMSIC